MPRFDQKNLMPWQSVKVHFQNLDDRIAFSRLIDQRLTEKTLYVWFPKPEIGTSNNPEYASVGNKKPRYPIFVISKGRWESRLTVKALDQLNVAYRVVIEPQELAKYEAMIPRWKLLVLPFSDLGQGSIPARNWVWEAAIKMGVERHWILDDNISGFTRLCDNVKTKVTDGSTFAACEDFADQYQNVALAGMNYHFFAKRKQLIPPYYLNTRIYSCILIKNDIPYRWRGRYNENTDLSLRVLRDGLCTVLFNAFLCDKAGTMTMKGGNTDELYQGDGRLEMAKSLQEQHPDYVRITRKWDRWQHHVDYSCFERNELIPNTTQPEAVSQKRSEEPQQPTLQSSNGASIRAPKSDEKASQLSFL